MATIAKATYTKAIPADARIVTKKGRQFAKFRHKGRPIDAPLTADGKKCRVETDEYYVRYKGADGKWQREKGYTDKQATEALAVRIEKRVAQRKEGISDPFEEHHRRPLAEHLADFRADLAAKGVTDKQVRLVESRAGNIIDGCGFKRIGDLSASRVQGYLGDRRQDGMSVQTSNHYLRAIKQFCLWLVKDRRTNDNPLSHLATGNAELDRRRIRRALLTDEVRRLLEATVQSPVTFRGLTGVDRFVLYYLALGSGLRASEVASLTPESFDLDADTPLVVVEAGTSKRRRRDEQPLQPDLVAILRDYLADKPAGQQVWPGSWPNVAAKILKSDLEAAGIPYIDASGRYADFHAQRHTYITVAAKTLPPRMAQALARHSSPTLTERYTHLELHDTGAAAAQLPPLLPETESQAAVLQATGTDDETPNRLPHTCQNSVFSRHSEAQWGTLRGKGPAPGEKPQTTTLAGPSTSRHAQSQVRLADIELASPGCPNRHSRLS